MLQTVAVSTLNATDEQVLSDEQLLGRIVRGQNWALSEIYDRYARLVFSIALKSLNDPGSAEEIVQQVFTKVWRHAQDYQVERGKFTTWLITIARRQCIDELRRRHGRLISNLGDWASLDEWASDADPVQDALDTMEQARVRQALQQIPSAQRTVIELAFFGGMTHQEIALHCHSPLGTVKTRLRLGMHRLRLLLQESV